MRSGGASFAAPYGPFTAIDNNSDIGRAHYDSLQIKAETKSARHGLYALLGYTYPAPLTPGSRRLGHSPGRDVLAAARSTAKLDWGLSQINLNNNFTASVLYDLPFGKGKHYGSNWNGAANADPGQLEGES